MPISYIEMLEPKTFETPYDLLHLEFIDWNRYGRFAKNMGDAVYGILNILKDDAAYSVIKTDLCSAPERDDFPDWHHVGTRHVPIAKSFWNWFYERHNGTLVFTDAPDFGGHINWPDGKVSTIIGDIGKVSVDAFVEGLRYISSENDFWISIPDFETQIIIQFRGCIREICLEKFGGI